MVPGLWKNQSAWVKVLHATEQDVLPPSERPRNNANHSVYLRKQITALHTSQVYSKFKCDIFSHRKWYL